MVLGEHLVGTDPLDNSFNFPTNRLASNFVPTVEQMLGNPTPCEWMDCGAAGGIAQQVISHNEFHFDNKNLARAEQQVCL